MIIATIILDLEWISSHQAEGRVKPEDSGGRGKEPEVETGKQGMGRNTALRILPQVWGQSSSD